jgi:predicted DNA-binding protein
MAINQELLNRIEASADDWGPTGKLGNDENSVRAGREDAKLNERLGLHPISIRFPKELIRDLRAIAQLNGMTTYQPLIREVCKRFVESEKRVILAAMAQRRQKEIEEQRKLEEETAAIEAEEGADERKAA